MAGSKEDTETGSAFFHDMRARGLGDPLLVVSDGAPGIIKAIETCFRDDFEACIAHLRVPINHRRGVCTTNLLERLFVEERRRMKIIPNAFGEKAVRKLMCAAMLRASERWRALRVTGFERRQMDALRKELDQNYKEDNDIRQPSAGVRQKKLSSIYRT